MAGTKTTKLNRRNFLLAVGAGGAATVAAIAARRCGQVANPLSQHFPNASDGLQGLRFVTAALASSNKQGAWTPL